AVEVRAEKADPGGRRRARLAELDQEGILARRKRPHRRAEGQVGDPDDRDLPVARRDAAAVFRPGTAEEGAPHQGTTAVEPRQHDVAAASESLQRIAPRGRREADDVDPPGSVDGDALAL